MNKEWVKHAMYYGLAISVLFILKFMASTSPNGFLIAINSLLAIVIPIVAIYFAIDCRRKLNEDRFTYYQAFRYLMRLLSSASLLCTFCVFVYIKWLNPDYLNSLHEFVYETINSLGSDTTDDMEQIVSMMLEPKIYTMSQFISFIFISFAISVIGAFFARKTDKVNHIINPLDNETER